MNTFCFRVQENTYVQSNRPDLSPCRSPHLPVGVWHDLTGGISCEYQSYLFFDISPVPGSHEIISATLALHYAKPPFTGNPPHIVELRALNDDFHDCQTSYNTKPSSRPSTALPFPIQPGFTAATIDIAHLACLWHSGVLANHGLVLLPRCWLNHGILVFASGNNPDWSLHPTLTIHTDAEPKSRTFNLEETHRVTPTVNFSKTREVWRYSTFSYIACNTGSKKILLVLQDSPDSSYFFDEGPEWELLPGASEVFVNQYFTRFSRLKFRLAPGETGTGKIKIWLQGRAG